MGMAQHQLPEIKHNTLVRIVLASAFVIITELALADLFLWHLLWVERLK